MSWKDQGRQYHEWFGHGTAPVALKPIAGAVSATLGERLQSVAHGAIGALPRSLRRQAEIQLQGVTLGRLTEAMAAWVHGRKMSAADFADHFFNRAADDPVVGALRAAMSEAVTATTQADLAAASGHLADAMKAVGLDSWRHFVADAQARAQDKATLVAIGKSLQPPDLKRDAIKPVSLPASIAVTAIALPAIAADGEALLAAGVRAVGGAIARKVLGEKPAERPSQPASPVVPTVEAPGKTPVAIDPVTGAEPSSQPAVTPDDPSTASVLDKLYRYILNPDHLDGKFKADWFKRALGFTRDNINDLAKQIAFDASKARQTDITEWGTKYNQTIAIVGANGRTLPVLTAWIKGADGIARLVTAVPGK